MDAITFNREFASLSNYLQAFAIRLTNDKTLAEDLYQDTALLAFRHREKYKPNTNMKAWLSTIMKNTFINDFRKKQKRSQIIDASNDGLGSEAASVSTFNDGETVINITEIQQQIDKLEEGLRKPFLMAYAGYKYDEISEEMDIPLGTVKSRIFFARMHLKQWLSRHQGEQRNANKGNSMHFCSSAQSDMHRAA